VSQKPKSCAAWAHSSWVPIQSAPSISSQRPLYTFGFAHNHKLSSVGSSVVTPGILHATSNSSSQKRFSSRMVLTQHCETPPERCEQPGPPQVPQELLQHTSFLGFFTPWLHHSFSVSSVGSSVVTPCPHRFRVTAPMVPSLYCFNAGHASYIRQWPELFST